MASTAAAILGCRRLSRFIRCANSSSEQFLHSVKCEFVGFNFRAELGILGFEFTNTSFSRWEDIDGLLRGRHLAIATVTTKVTREAVIVGIDADEELIDRDARAVVARPCAGNSSSSGRMACGAWATLSVPNRRANRDACARVNEVPRLWTWPREVRPRMLSAAIPAGRPRPLFRSKNRQ
jgi:hypothetical protein